MSNDRFAYYMSLRYPIELRVDPDGRGYVALHRDLPGCVSQGASADEAVASLNDARALWIRVHLEDDMPIPEPVDVDDYSGRFVLRVPKSIHAELARRAGSENVSLNHYVSAVLSRHLGAAPMQTFVRQYTARLEDALADLRTVNKSSASVTTAKGQATSDIASYFAGVRQMIVGYTKDTNTLVLVNEPSGGFQFFSADQDTETREGVFRRGRALPWNRQAISGKP